MFNHGNLRILAPALLVVGGVVVLQYHSMQFWNAQAGAGIGWLWSLLIELAGLWLWYQPDWASRLLGAVASVVLLAAPLYFLGSVAMVKLDASRGIAAQKQVKTQAQHASIAALERSISSHQLTISTYLDNSKNSAGWSKAIADVQALMQRDQDALQALRVTQVTPMLQKSYMVTSQPVTSVTSLITMVLLQCAGLIVIQIANIKAMMYMANVTKLQVLQPRVTPPATSQVQTNIAIHVASPVGHGGLLGVDAMQAKCNDFLRVNHMSGRAFAAACEVSPAQVSFLLNYQAGGRKPSKSAMAAFAAVLA